jgi:hypothetical protein
MATAGETETSTQRISRITDVAEEPLKFLMPISGYEKMPLVSLEEAVEKLVHILPLIQTYVYVAKQRCKQPADGLTQDESAAIMLYTMGWAPLDECLYIVLNATLRSSNRKELTPWFLYLRLFLNALSHLPTSSRSVYRGVKMDLSKQYVKGNKIIWWGFSSCTTTMDVLQSEQFLGKTGIRTLLAIDCFNGKNIRNHSYFSSEDEILLLPATHFVVSSCLHQTNLIIIHLK